jgi:hypothetical protein
VNAAVGTTLGVAVIVVVLVVIPLVYVLVQARKARSQRSGLGRFGVVAPGAVAHLLAGFPVADIGTSVYLPPHRLHRREPSRGIWTWGGIVVLDRAGRAVRHVVAVPGSSVPLDLVHRQLPAPVHRECAITSRAAFRREFPGSLRPGQLRGATFWSLAALAAVVVLAVLAIVISLFVLVATG